jgi:hypothetical protein
VLEYVYAEAGVPLQQLVLGVSCMQYMIKDDAKGDVDIEGASFAVHGQEHGRIASR